MLLSECVWDEEELSKTKCHNTDKFVLFSYRYACLEDTLELKAQIEEKLRQAEEKSRQAEKKLQQLEEKVQQLEEKVQQLEAN